MTFAPKSILPLIRSCLLNDRRPAYGQVATVDAKGQPQVRTVHFRYIEKMNTVGFSTNVKSQKWRQLRGKRSLAGCYYDTDRSIQFRWSGPIVLIDARSSNPVHQALLDERWRLMRPKVRAAYWKDFGAKTFDINQRCPNLGMVACSPKLWDIFRMRHEEYINSKRMIYELKNQKWSSRRISILHGATLKSMGDSRPNLV